MHGVHGARAQGVCGARTQGVLGECAQWCAGCVKGVRKARARGAQGMRRVPARGAQGASKGYTGCARRARPARVASQRGHQGEAAWAAAWAE